MAKFNKSSLFFVSGNKKQRKRNDSVAENNKEETCPAVLEFPGLPAVRNVRSHLLVLLPFIALLILLASHLFIPDRQHLPQKPYFNWLVELAVLFFGVAAITAAYRWQTQRSLQEKAPLVAAFTAFLLAWDLLTVKFGVLPRPYFPAPGTVVDSFIAEWKTLAISAFYSLRLLAVGYGLGVLIGLPTGVLMGWYPRVNYWVNPLLRTIGPIPATAWIPIAMVVFPTSFTASIFLLILSCWFPITVMTWSGIANVNKAYYEVARSLGASEFYLITRVALPAAMPSIFVGLFMSLGTAFVTLIVSEMLGVKAGLGWFITWAQGWAEYGKVYSALVVMSVLFSGIITLLFYVRDKVLVWQKGLVKW